MLIKRRKLHAQDRFPREQSRRASRSNASTLPARAPRPQPLVSRVSDAERAAHAAFIDELGDDALWKRLSNV